MFLNLVGYLRQKLGRFNMFDREYTFSGAHAEMVRALTSNPFKEEGNQKGLFQRNIDVYMISPIVGLLYNRKSRPDSSSNLTSKIFTDAFLQRTDELNFIYTTIILNDREIAENDKRIENAFKNKYEKTNKNFEILFDSYLLGGLEFLYEKLIKNTQSFDEVLSNFNLFIEDFNATFSKSTQNKQSIYDQEELEII